MLLSVVSTRAVGGPVCYYGCDPLPEKVRHPCRKHSLKSPANMRFCPVPWLVSNVFVYEYIQRFQLQEEPPHRVSSNTPHYAV